MPNKCDHLLSDIINVDDAKSIYDEVSANLKIQTNISVKESLKNVLNNKVYDLLENKTISKLNLQKAKEFLNNINKNKISPIDYLVRRPNAKDQSLNVETFAANHAEDFNNILLNKLTLEESKLLGDSKHDLNIVKAFDKKLSDIKYKQIAENIANYFKYRDVSLVTSTAFKHKQLLDNYYFRVSHDTSALSKVSKSEWVEFTSNLLDESKTAQLLGVPPAKINSSLENIYDELESGQLLSDVNEMDLTKPSYSGKAHRVLIFKDLTSQYLYNEAFGEFKGLNGLLKTDFNRSAMQIANSELLGSNPNLFVKNILNQDRLFKNNLDRQLFKNIQTYYYGAEQSVTSPTVTTLANTLRVAAGLPRLLGVLPFYAVQDIPQRILYLRNSGANVWESIITPFTNAIKGASFKDIDLLKHYVDTFFTNSVFKRSGIAVPKFLDKASKLVYHGFGLKSIEHTQMQGLIAFKARQLGINSTKTYEKLNSALQRNLKTHGINSEDWSELRKIGLNSKYITPEQINTLNISNANKLILRRKLRSLYLEAANNAVLSNGLYENAIYSMGTKPGTPLGEGIRSIMQFKSFGLNFLRKVVIQQAKNAYSLDRKLESALLYALTIVPLSFASNALLSYSKGLIPTNPFKENWREQVSYTEDLLLGNMGALLAFINPTGNKSLTDKLVSSPLTKTINKIYDSAFHLDHIPKNVASILNLDNAPLISVILRKALYEMGGDGIVPLPYKDESQDYLFN